MIQSGSYLKVVDSSGVNMIGCIQASKKNGCKYAYIGDIIVASVKSLRRKNKKRAKVKVGDIVTAIIVRTKYNVVQGNNISVYNNNLAVLLDLKNEKLVGSRVTSGVPRNILKNFKSKLKPESYSFVKKKVLF